MMISHGNHERPLTEFRESCQDKYEHAHSSKEIGTIEKLATYSG